MSYWSGRMLDYINADSWNTLSTVCHVQTLVTALSTPHTRADIDGRHCPVMSAVSADASQNHPSRADITRHCGPTLSWRLMCPHPFQCSYKNMTVIALLWFAYSVSVPTDVCEGNSWRQRCCRPGWWWWWLVILPYNWTVETKTKIHLESGVQAGSTLRFPLSTAGCSCCHQRCR